MLLKKKKSKRLVQLIGATLSALILLLSADAASAAPCDIVPAAPVLIRHDLSTSYCELCSYGYVTIVITNPYEGADMTDMTVVENLGSSGLTFHNDPSTPVTVSINGGPAWPTGDPVVSGSILTWTQSEIPELGGPLAYRQPWPSSYQTIAITFPVTRPSGDQEGLVFDDRDIQARLTYSTEDATGSAPFPPCPGNPQSVTTSVDELPLLEPNPSAFKRGRNVDAGQNEGEYTQTVYGNVKDDVIWRIQVRNDGTANLQDLRLDDQMESGNININYICPSAASASAIAANNGIDPGGTGCLPAGNTINNFDVDNPFGNPGNDSPDMVDVPDGQSAYVYLVGKVPDMSPNGSCETDRKDNTVSDIQWGCQSEPSPAGGIGRTSAGITPVNATATLSTFSNNNLTTQVRFIGYGGNPVTGAKGRVRITITNNTGATVTDLRLRNELPLEYVVDSTFTPTISATGAYGYYPGLTNQIQWDNPDANPLNNKIPEFTLTSSETNPHHSEQNNMLRNGDRLVITFGIILIRPLSYDKMADLDVQTESPGDGTDPNHASDLNDLTNTLDVYFENFCTSGDTQNTFVTTHDPRPEDLDINFLNNELVFILTGDPAQRLPLTVVLTNNGGHSAEDYTAYVTFGRTMDVVREPLGCRPTSNPPPLDEWQYPASIPPGATIYECTGPDIDPGDTANLAFEVVKSTNAADIAADDLTFRADVIGEITDNGGNLLTYPPINVPPRSDSGSDRANNYSLDGLRARVVGFNLLKSQLGNCTENNPPPAFPDLQVQIGEECTYHIDTGGWFGFKTPGFTFIAVQNIEVDDELPNGQGWLRSGDSAPPDNTTSAIQGISRAPSPLNPLNEGWVTWSFNAGQPITEIDHWFRRDMSTRLLNDPINTSGDPNLHSALSTNTLNSTFDAIFRDDTTGLNVTHNLGSGTVGYPRVEVRQISLTATEPQITVIKEVCNESLNGAGPTCGIWEQLADDGDAYDAYIYRLTLTNEERSGGVQRAPAYDVTLTDRLDASDLAYVLPFDADGLDNDGDGAIDEADEGVISDNTVRNGISAVITFTYTHSSPLLRINPGQSVQLYYRVDYDDDAAPLQTFTNTAVATYDSLDGAFGNQTAPQLANGDSPEFGGARVYTSPVASADVRVIPVQTQPKRITALSNTPPVGAGSTQDVSIGEEIEYRLNTLLPVALLRNFVIRDELPAGLRCSEAPVVNLNIPPYSAANFVPGGIFTPTCTDGFVEWNFGDQRVTNGTIGNRYDFEIGFIARVENTAGTNDADVLSNGDPATIATASYIDESGNTVVLTFGQLDVLVQEPLIDLTKAFAVAAADAGDILTVTVTATNTGTATAYNLRVLDDLTGRNMTFTGTVGGSNPPGTIDTTTLGANRPIFSWNPPIGIDAGDSISFTFDVRVDTVVQPLEVLDNTIQADWTSLPSRATALNSTGQIGANGSEIGMRIGALPNAGDTINDYEANAENQAAVPAVTLTKTDIDPALIPTIGVHKSFQVDIRLPEGTTQGLLVTDSLNTAGISYFLENNASYDITYSFQGIATINGAVPNESAFTAFPVDNTSGSAVWNIGTVVTQTENDPTQSAIAPLIRIEYFARVNNDLVTDNGDALQNSVVVNYSHGETGAQEVLTDTTAPVTVVESALSVTKTMSNVTSPGNPAGGGDVLEYVIVGLNSGTATAHDVNLVDTLPAELTLEPGFTPTAIINGVSVAGFVATPANAPNGPLVWGRENADGSLDIPVGQSLVLTYRLVVQEVSGDLNNSVWTDWTSLDGTSGFERTGEGCPSWTAPNDYCFGPAVATTTTVDENSILKAISADTYDVPPLSTAVDAIARVGDTITYRLALDLRGGLTRNVQVQDILPGGMAVVDMVGINGDATAAYTPPAAGPGSNFAYAPISAANVPAAGQTGTLTWTIGDVVNNPLGDPTTDTLEIIYRARILPDSGIAHVSSTTLNNTASLNYIGAPLLNGNAVVTLHQPVIATVTKTERSGLTSPVTVDVVNDTMLFRLEACNTGSAPAYSIEMSDQLATQLDETSIANLVVSANGAVLSAGSDYAYTPPAVRGGTLHVLLTTPIDPGQCLTIDYDIGFYTDFGPNQTWNNSVTVDAYWSLPAQSGQLYGPEGPATFFMNNTTTIEPPAKAILSPASAEATIGQEIVYRITVPVTPVNAALNDVRIVDDLNASAADLSFVSVAKVSGSQPWTPVNTGTATNLVIEDTTTGIDIPAGEQIVLDITVVLEDTPTNVSGLQFNNTADYTYNAINDDPASQAPGGSDTTPDITIVGPDALTLEKSGPATMQVGTPAGFTLNVHNPSTGAAWNPTITDRLPHGATGGMCAAGPSNVAAQIFQSDGVTPVSALLVEGTDFTVNFSGQPSCEWQFSLLSSAGGLAPDLRLIVHYDLDLDLSTENGTVLTNVAGVTQWFSADPEAAGSTPRTYDRELTDGTPGTLDHEDSHSVTCEAAILAFSKIVQNVTTGQNPGSNASPGDTLRYTIQLSNSGPVGVSAFSIVDEVDRLNAIPAFAPGSLGLINVPAGADTSGTSAVGGTNGTGLVNVANLDIGAQGDANDTIEVVFEITLAPAITHGTVVLNQAELVSANPDRLQSDDPNVSGDTDPTETLIASAPAFEVQKISTILSGDPNVLMAGETLRYTITIKNIGSEDAIDVRLRDNTPANTAYVANSTTLNGTAVSDPSPGVNPLHAGILVNAPENATTGYLRADATPGATNVATVTFDVVVDPSAMNGLIIENQGFLSASGAGSGLQPEQPSDDPATPIPDDPTRNVVGNLPLLYAHKTVQIQEDFGSPGIVDPGDVLRYSILISNFGAIPATVVTLTDAVPANTSYIADSMRLNGSSVGPDGGVSPLIAGMMVQSSDNPGNGIVSAGSSALITFEARVNAGVPTGTLISNQGRVTSNELPSDLTDADGLPSNGDQPTVIVVGDAQLLSVTKEVAVVGGGAATAGGQLEYTIRATNIGRLPATRVIVTDDLSPPLGNQVTYIAGSGTLNGSAAGVTYVGSMLSADYAGQYGNLQPGSTAIVRFRVQIDASLSIGTTISNTGVVRWNDPAQNASASVSLDVGGTPGSALLNGNVWHDANLDKICDTASETLLEGWSVELYRNGQLVTTVLTGANGAYRLSGLVPNEGTAELYELRFRAAGAGPNTASLGYADSPFTNGPQQISAITVASGSILQNLHLPLWPNGTVYNSVARVPVAGTRLTLLNAATGTPLPTQCFDDPIQQNQITAQDGFYKFDLNFSDGSCPAGGAYLIEVTPAANGYMPMPSQIIPPTSDATTTAFSIPTCPGSASDAVPSTVDYCEVTTFSAIPPLSAQPGSAGTIYYLHLVLNNGSIPGHSQVFNNPIPVDPELGGAVSITKTSSKTNVTRGDLVPYTITVSNLFGAPLDDISIVDRLPAGFKYVADSARLDGQPTEPLTDNRQLVWGDLNLQVNEKKTIQFLLVVSSGVSEGEYVNRAQVVNTVMNTAVSGEATATVRVVPDPDFDCTDVIGKVFDDRNLNGQQEKGEKGLAGVRVVTARGLIATTDEHGRFHITCVVVPNEDRGSNFILKVDERSLPTGFRMTTENPRVQRATRGKMIRFKFGATIHRVVRIDLADSVFEPQTSELRLQWKPRIDQLLDELKKSPSVLHLSYLADVESKRLVHQRLSAMKKKITRQWKQTEGGYRLDVETEIFWRRGAPLSKR